MNKVKYICIEDYRFLNYGAKNGDIIEIEETPFCFSIYKDGKIIDMIVEISNKHFVILAEWRDKQINSILED
jgi:hypothetical protein